MSNLWVFGDSFSVPWKKVEAQTLIEYRTLYKPTYHFTDIVKNLLNISETFNYSVPGYCNYSILESIGANLTKIKTSDYVVIGWSSLNRWRSLSLNDNKWTVITPNLILPKKKAIPEGFFKESINRESVLIANELNSWITILNHALPKTTLHWTPFQYTLQHFNISMYSPNFKLDKISEKTPIKDTHFTSNAHRKIGEWMCDFFNNRFITKII